MIRQLREARITVNGEELTDQQSRIVRISLSLFLMGMQHLELTQGLADSYAAAAREVLQMIEQTGQEL